MVAAERVHARRRERIAGELPALVVEAEAPVQHEPERERISGRTMRRHARGRAVTRRVRDGCGGGRDDDRTGCRRWRRGRAGRRRRGCGRGRQPSRPGDDDAQAGVAGRQHGPPAVHLARGLGDHEAQVGRLGIDERARGLFVVGRVAGEQQAGHRGRSARAVADGAGAHEDLVHVRREGRGRRLRRRGGRGWRRAGCRRRRRLWSRRRCARDRHRRRMLRDRRPRCGRLGGRRRGACRGVEAGAAANPGHHALVGDAGRGPRGAAAVERRARGLGQERARVGFANIGEAGHDGVIGHRVARQQQARGSPRRASGMAGLAGRHQQRVDRPPERRRGRRGIPAGAHPPLRLGGGLARCGAGVASLARRRRGNRRAGGRGGLFLEAQVLEDLAPFPLLRGRRGALGGHRSGAVRGCEHRGEHQESWPATTAHRRGTVRRARPVSRRRGGPRDSARRIRSCRISACVKPTRACGNSEG